MKFQNLETSLKNPETLLRSKVITFVKSEGRKQYLCSFLQYQILKAQKRINHDEYCYHVKQFILESEKLYCNFHILFICYVLYFPLWTSTLYFLCFAFFFMDRSWKQALSIQTIHPCFVKGRSSVSQTYQLQQLKMKSNTSWVT